MIIDGSFDIGFLLLIFALLGAVLIDGLFETLKFERLHPRLIGATVGVLLGFALIEAVPLFT